MQRSRLLHCALMLLGLAASVSGAAAAYPEKAIRLIVPWAAGGGTDATGRIVAQLLENELGQPVNVVNRTGGGGIIGHADISKAAPDGYTIGILTSELSVYHWLKQSPLTYKDFDLVGLFNSDPHALHVAKGSKYSDVGALAAALKNNASGAKVGGASRGGANHLAYVSFLQAIAAAADKANWIPTEGAAPALQLLTSGAIDAVAVNLPEARALVEAGEVMAVASFGDQRDPNFPDVPTVKEKLGVDVPVRSWRGVGGPKNMPQEVLAKLRAAMSKVVGSDEFRELMKKRQFSTEWKGGADFEAFLVGRDDAFGRAAKAAGLVK